MAATGNKVHVDLLHMHKSTRELVQEQVDLSKKMGCDDQFVICDLGDIIDKYQQWTKLMPRVKPFYAVKCNNDSAVLKVLSDCGASFDCASKDEVQKILSLGVSPSRIIYANTVKQPSMLKYAVEHGVSLMTFDSEAELRKIKSLCPDAKLVLRTLPAGDFKCKIDLRQKFGCPLSKIRTLLQTAKDLDLDVVGTSFHVGSGCHDGNAYIASIRQARSVFNMAAELGISMKLLNIGGGYPGESSSRETFVKITEAVNKQLDKDFTEDDNVEIIAEPGSYMVSSSAVLAVNIIGKRMLSRKDLYNEEDIMTAGGDDDAPSVMYYVNDGVYGSFTDVLIVPENLDLDVQTLTCNKDEICYESAIWGPTCCGFDCIIKSTKLPMSEVGDWFYFRDMGAYTIVFVCSFNGMTSPRRIFVCAVETWRKIYPDSHDGDLIMPENKSNGF
ncbi:ornithine decarboxylase 1-like [Mercenaria mercenaria]|uniref:ornithine decarboxylase 1-like n=1 Tax=Mercenaria mercenaria TaxID=6596 RepID=UPI00234E4852|nr:ornithine decarboxylase 1-like [Mercenaria mercenaria]